MTSYASATRVSRGYMVCARVAWLHGLRPCACRVVTWFARVSHGYMVCARARVAWLHGLRACRMVTWFAPVRVSRGYMVCARVAWLHGLRPCACRVVTWFAYSPSPSPTTCGQICELQRCSVSSIFKKGDREDPANYRGITLLSVVGKVFCKILNNRLVPCLDKEGALHEGQAGFRINRSCMDNVYTLNEIVQSRLREDKKTYAFFLDIQKAYDSVWHDGLWYKLWDMGVKGRMWRVIKKM